MSWVFTSRRYKGFAYSPPRVEFAIGAVIIAKITMLQSTGKDWQFVLDLNGVDNSFHPTFSAALTELHRLLKAPAPEGFET